MTEAERAAVMREMEGRPVKGLPPGEHAIRAAGKVSLVTAVFGVIGAAWGAATYKISNWIINAPK
jgi:hypothetical protein